MRKIRIALFFGYSGNNYNGMQYQTENHVITIENQLINKFYQEQFLKTNVYNQLVKNYKWSRAARTDKGVHALVNGISCIFTVKNQYWIKREVQINQQQNNQINEKVKVQYILNKELLLKTFQSFFSQITIYSIKQVEKKFDMRTSVKNRIYCYMCPINMIEVTKTQEDVKIVLQKINNLCKFFVGTHNFHNYSSGIKAKDPAAKRYILSMKCEIIKQNILFEQLKNVQVWVRFKIHGQSFIYHQIRKMIGMIIQNFINKQPDNFIQNSFFNNQMRIMLAPPEGLYLESLNFQGYNRGMYIPQKINFDIEKQKIQEKRLYIQKIIFQNQIKNKKFTEWRQKIQSGQQIKQIEQDKVNQIIEE